MLLRLTYASRIANGLGNDEIDTIVAKARIANADRGITGVIAFDGEKILQILEGPEAEVASLFEKIRTDPRHEGVVELKRSHADEPRFKGWSMTRRPIADVYLYAEAV